MTRQQQILRSKRLFRRLFDNSVQAFNPTYWANESLAILEENMVIGQLVNRDFQATIQNFGDTVNTRRIGELEAKRKTNADNVTVQDVTATTIPVKLDQHVHVSFLIRDGEESIAVESLVDTYMAPAMRAQARFVDQVLLAQMYRFMANSYGRLGKMLPADVVDAVTGVRNLMNINKAPVNDRFLMLTPTTETTFLRNADFVDASKIGDDGTALRNASLGRLYGFNNFMTQNSSSIIAGNTGTVGAVNSAGDYAVGATTITVDGFAAAITAGTYFTVDGDDVPQRVASTVGGATPTSITFTPGLKHAVVDNAPVRTYTPGAVNNSGGFPSGFAKVLVIDGFTVAPRVGQMVSFGVGTAVYGIVDVDALVGITLDRPLEAAVADNEAVNLGPPGDYNFAFLRNALTMVVRPLATPRAGTGALSAVVNVNGLSMRATITYDGNKQGTLVTLDMLMGVQVLDERLGAVLLA